MLSSSSFENVIVPLYGIEPPIDFKSSSSRGHIIRPWSSSSRGHIIRPRSSSSFENVVVPLYGINPGDLDTAIVPLYGINPIELDTAIALYGVRPGKLTEPEEIEPPKNLPIQE